MPDARWRGRRGGGFTGDSDLGGGHHGGHSSGHCPPGAGGHHLHQAYGTDDGADADDPEFPERRARYWPRRGQPGYRLVRIAVRLVLLAFVAYWIFASVH